MERLRLFLSWMFLGIAILAATATGEEPQSAQETVVPGLDFSILDDDPKEEKEASATPEPEETENDWTPEAKTAFNEVFYIHELGDPKRLVFEGAQLFTEKQLRSALALDLKYQVAARPSNRSGNFLDTLEKRLREGYLRSGCPDVDVSTLRDGQRKAVVVRIEEGPRFRMGEIRVTRHTHVDAAALTSRLTAPQQRRAWRYVRGDAPYPPSSDKEAAEDADDEDEPAKYWKPGELVDFRTDPKTKFEEGVRLALDDLGYAAASFHVEMVRDPENEQIHAQISILSESSPTTISQIEVTGLKRDTEEALLQYLKIAPGDRLAAEVLQRISDRLADSCRYWTHEMEVVMEPGDDATGRASANAVLRLDLEEYAAVPQLGEPLSATDEVLRKTAAWVKSLVTDPKSPDLICTLAGANLGGALHATRVGLAADGTIAIEARLESVRGLALDHTFIAGPGCAEIYDWNFGEKFCCSPDWHPLVRLLLTAEHESDGKQTSRLKLGYLLPSSGKNDRSAEHPGGVRVEPVALLRLVHLPETNVELSDGELTLRLEGLELVIDEATGQLRSLQVATFPLIGVSTIYLEARSGAVAEMVKRARSRADEFPNQHDVANPVVSVLCFGLEQCERQPFIAKQSSRLSFCRAARQLIESRELREALAEMRSDSRDNDDGHNLPKFQIADVQNADGSDWFAKTLPYGPSTADVLFPHGSMPWTLVREYCFWRLSSGQADENFDEFKKQTKRELNRVLSDDMGPISHVLLARAFHSISSDSPKFGAAVAQKGLAELSDAAIAKDVELLTNGDQGLAVACRAGTELLGKMSEEDQRQLLELVPEDFRAVIRQLIVRRGEKPDEPPADAMKHVLMETWHSGLRDAVEAELRSLSVQIAEKAEADKPAVK
jgi:hypothetical protein